MRGIQGFGQLPLLWLSLFFMIGVWLAAILGLPVGGWMWLAVACVFLMLLPRLFRWAAANRPGAIRTILNWLPQSISHRLMKPLVAPVEAGRIRPAVVVLACILAAAAGGARYQFSLPKLSPAHLAWYNDMESPAEVIGMISRPSEVRDSYVQIVLKVEQVTPEGGEARQVEGQMLARLPAGGEWHYGDQIRLWGLLETPPENEDFSYKDYLARQQIYSYVPYAGGKLIEHGKGNPILAWVYSIRERGTALIYTYLPDPEASLLAGIVLGVESGIPYQVEQDFQDTGTTHVIAISGFNITIVAGLFAMIFGRLLGERRGAVAAVVAIGLYTVLVGGDAPVVRAAIMGGFSLFARQVGRRQHGLNSLAISAGLMMVFNPLLLWDVGFQLSFTATLGLVLYAEPWGQAVGSWLEKWMPLEAARRVTGLLSDYLLLTLAAQLTTLPVLAYHFHRLSVVSLPANLAILPAQPPVMMVGGLAVLAGLVVPVLGQWLAYAVWPFLAYTIRAVAWFAGFSGGVLTLGWFHPVWVVVFYAILLGLTFYWEEFKEKMNDFGRVRGWAVLAVLAVLSVLVWQAVLSAPDGLLRVTFLDVGNGEAVLVQTPEGRYMLIGGGESAIQLSYGLGRRLPLFHRQLDILVVAGTQAEQIDALPEVVERFPPEQVWWAGEPGESRPGRELYAWVRDKDIPMERMQAGQVLDLGEGAQLEVVHVSEGGAVLMLSWGGLRCLLPVGALPEDLGALEVEGALAEANILLVPGSGDAELGTPDWLEKASLNAAIISVDALNRYGLPDGETLTALDGTMVLRTDEHGWIEFSTDGERLWVQVERE